MLNSLICGSFHHQEDDGNESWPPCSSPKRSKRTSSFKFKESKNRFANRGLDKFDALLAEVDNKKQMIYTQKGAEDISLVRFVYSDDNKIKPVIVVKVKDKKQQEKTIDHHANNIKEKILMKNIEASEKNTKESSKTAGKKEVQRSRSSLDNEQRPKREQRLTFNFKLENLRQPSYCLPLITILILLLLAIYGRSFAILCTSIGWYLLPLIKGGDSASRNPRRKKEYTRRLSERKHVSDGSSSPTSVIAGPADMSPGKHGHRRSF